jgi:hypothetical protein
VRPRRLRGTSGRPLTFTVRQLRLAPRFRTLIWLVASIAAVVAAWWAFSYHSSEFHGGGQMRDGGIFSYPPRFRAPLGSFPFGAEGIYSFNFSGLPNERMTLLLYVPGYSSKTRENIEPLRTLISADIVDGSGVTICRARGSPDGSNAGRWTLTSSPFDAALWNEACRDGLFRRRRNYTLRVTVHSADLRTPSVNLTAVLEGGGIDTP